jgi:hypothetical protein
MTPSNRRNLRLLLILGILSYLLLHQLYIAHQWQQAAYQWRDLCVRAVEDADTWKSASQKWEQLYKTQCGQLKEQKKINNAN